MIIIVLSAQVSAREVHEAYCTLRRDAGQKDKHKGRAPDKKDPMRLLPCYLCGGSGGGVDRVDSNGSYDSRENIRPACTMCNLMKNCVPLQHFLSQVARIRRGRNSSLWFS